MYMHIILCIHFHVTIVTVLETHSCVWIVAGLVVFVLYSFSSLTFDALYIYTYHTSQNHLQHGSITPPVVVMLNLAYVLSVLLL